MPTSKSTVRTLKREAKAAYDLFWKKGTKAIAANAAIVVQMPLVREYSQGMGSWNFNLAVASYKGDLLVSPSEPIGENDLPRLRRILSDRDAYKDASFEWREDNPPPSQADCARLEKVIAAIEDHYELIQDLEDCLGGSFLGDPLTLVNRTAR